MKKLSEMRPHEVSVSTRVQVHGKPGRLNYMRMGRDGFPEAVSIIMDEKAHKPGYAGTMWKAEEVEVLE